jgi:hypothetical protein
MIEMASKTEVSTMIDIASIKTGVEVLEKLGVLDRLTLKLVNNPHKAARQLNLALSELSRGYTVFYWPWETSHLRTRISTILVNS